VMGDESAPLTRKLPERVRQSFQCINCNQALHANLVRAPNGRLTFVYLPERSLSDAWCVQLCAVPRVPGADHSTGWDYYSVVDRVSVRDVCFTPARCTCGSVHSVLCSSKSTCRRHTLKCSRAHY
jgi:hypothetical protein